MSHLFTCIACAVAFNDPALQRTHFASDWHRYNMKRRVASLPPLSALTFNDKVLEKREQNAVRIDPRGMYCNPCRKQYSTDNAYRTHIASKKHKEVAAKHEQVQKNSAEGQPSAIVESYQEESDSEAEEEPVPAATAEQPADKEQIEEIAMPQASSSTQPPVKPTKLSHMVSEDTSDSELALTLEQKLLASRSLHPTTCLFCPHKSTSLAQNFTHMLASHSFFVPEQTFLSDPTGLLLYLGEKLAVGNVCLFCELEFGSLEAVRGHMKDKRHQKIRYETDIDRAEFAEYYDFSTSYPDAEERKIKDAERAERREARRLRREAREERRRKREEELNGDGGWEEDEGEDVEGEDVDEVVVVEGSQEGSDDEIETDTDSEDDSEFENDNGISFAPDGLSLRLPSGRTLGHKSLNVYYNQHFRPTSSTDSPSASLALTTKLRSVRAKLADPSLGLVAVGGGSGAFGKGQQVMKARNAGEAKWAKKLAGQHLDQKMNQAPRFKVSMRGGNNQKHFRDPLLQ